MVKTAKYDRNKIESLILQGKGTSEIAQEIGCSEALVSTYKRELYQELDKLDNPVYIEYLDHAVVDRKPDVTEPPILACIGVIDKENDDAIILKQIWSKTTRESFRHSVIVKKAIKKIIQLKKVKT